MIMVKGAMTPTAGIGNAAVGLDRRDIPVRGTVDPRLVEKAGLQDPSMIQAVRLIAIFSP